MRGLSFEILDWADPGSAQGSELCATWARLRIQIDDVCATRVVSGQAGGARDHVYLPLYPLAEWIVANWWYLLGEVRTPRLERLDYDSKHSLRYSGDGFALPNLTIRPLGGLSDIALKRRVLLHQQLEFIEEGRFFIPSSTAMSVLENFVGQVLERLDDKGVTNTALQQEWNAVQEVRADPEEYAFCNMCARLGEDPFAVDERTAEIIEKWSQTINEAEFQEICSALTSSSIERGLNWVKRVSSRLSEAQSPWTTLPTIKEKMLIGASKNAPTSLPWIVGYADAQRLRRNLGLNGEILRSVDDLLNVFQPEATVNDALLHENDDVGAFDAFVAVPPSGVPSFLTTKSLASSKKFSFCRSVYDYFQLQQSSFAVATRSHSQIQQASRAFAAEFLAPFHVLKKEIDSEILDWDEVTELASQFNVSEWVIQHQVINHRLADVVDERARW